ncbi:MAG: choice-of-anchor O protein [Gammaproteobacteria bacterium]
MKTHFKTTTAVALGVLAVVATAYAATQLLFSTPTTISVSGQAYKSKINRLGDGTLVVAYGDTVAGAGTVYDVKERSERSARDIFVRTCKSLTTDCNVAGNWSAAMDISNSALLSSIQTDWQGTGALSPYPGDTGKPNLNSAGTVSVLTWESSYCPGDVQRAVKYSELADRIIPFKCIWESHSLNSGATWSAPQQLSSGERDAIQDSNKGVYTRPTGTTPANGRWVLAWQEDPQGLQLGEAEGPGEGASGAKVSAGTDVWYASATFTKNPNSFTWATPVRLTDNHTGSLDPTAVSYVYDSAGCVISDPVKNARRVRFVYQSPTNAMPLVIFWREGLYTQGGPSDIVARRAMGGLSFDKLVPPVDPNCQTGTSDYATAFNLQNSPAENLSSHTPNATVANLTDDTEADWAESAQAHRALLRGDDVWVGYNYTPDLGALQNAQTANYNFWLRHFNAATGVWDNPRQMTHITDTGINVKEPRLVGTQGSSAAACPSGDPAAGDTTDPTLCQNADVFYVAWGEQTNVPASDPAGPQNLGLHITRTTDGGMTFESVVPLSIVQGGPGQPIAAETQFNVRPDGNMAFAVWNQTDPGTGSTDAMYSSGTVVMVPDAIGGDTPPAATGTSSGGGALSPWTLLTLLGLGGLRILGRSRQPS